MMLSQLPPEFDALVRIAVRMRSLSDTISEASKSIPDDVTVIDTTRSLMITMTRTGNITHVQMEYDWKKAIHPNKLGDALTALIGQAHHELLGGFNEALAEAFDGHQMEDSEPVNLLTDPRAHSFRDDVEALLSRSHGEAVPLEQALADTSAYVDKVHAFVTARSHSPDSEETDSSTAPVRCLKTAGRPTSILVNGYWAKTTPFPLLHATIRDELVAHGDDIEALSQDLESQGTAVFMQLLGNMTEPVNF